MHSGVPTFGLGVPDSSSGIADFRSGVPDLRSAIAFLRPADADFDPANAFCSLEVAIFNPDRGRTGSRVRRQRFAGIAMKQQS